MTDPVDTNDAVWSRAFDWLRAVELDGHDLESALVSGVGLRERVKTLAVLFDLLPRSEIGRLSDVVTAWNQQFGEQSNVPLVELRRVARDVVAVRDNKHQEGDLWQRAAKLSRWRPDVVPLAKLPVSSSEVTDTDRKCCTEGIAAWLRELQENPQRRSIPGVIPGEADRPMSDVYVELLAVEDGEVFSTDESNSAARIRGRQNRSAEHSPPITIEAMISRTVERCVVIGDPGSGKSTLVRWLVWAAFEGRLADFDLAIEVKLSAYAAALVADENLTPLEYFFRSQGLNASDASKAAHGLSQTARESQRWLLLFDGWDEVPVAQRVIVKAQLRHVEPAFVTLITSRPSGMPRLLLERQHVACYRIAGLTPLLAQELTAKVLGLPSRSEACEGIWNRIQYDPQLLEMAANPFLLGMLVRALARSEARVRGTRADVYRQLTAWVREHYEQIRGANAALTSRHLDGLAELSYRLLNDPSLPRYLFSRRELESSLSGVDAEPVLQSRFVTRPVSLFDEFALLHATIQEYLAAEHAAGCSTEEQQAFLERTFCSASRFILLEFFVGLGGASSQLAQQVARSWWSSKDRFLQVALRLARLAVAGQWPIDDLNQAIRHSLWAAISSEEDVEACESAASAYAELDPVDVVRRARQNPPTSWAVNCLLNVVPPAIAKQERLQELLTPEWAEFEGLSSPFDFADRELTELKQLLQQWDASPADLNEAVRVAGATQDESLLPLLIAIAKTDTLHGMAREEALTSIGRIGGVAAVPVMVDLLLSGNAISDVMARMAGIIFTQPSSHRLRLDPRGRDRILRRLAAVPPTDPRAENYLNALNGFPIREGAEVISQLACGPDIPIGVRRKAIAVLASVSDRQLLTSLLSRIDTEPAELLGDWLSLALQRSLPVPILWLQDLIRRTRDRLQRDKYLRVYCRVLVLENAAVQQQHAKFLGHLIRLAAKQQHEASDLSLALTGAFNSVADHRGALLSQMTLNFALKLLAWSIEGRADVNADQTLLAIAIVRHFRETNAGPILRQLLDRLRENLKAFADDKRARAAADCLAELAPVELLKSPINCPVVTSILRTRSLKHGWVVYSDRILSAEGACVATLAKTDYVTVTELDEPLELQTLLAELSPQARRVLECFWLMTRLNGPCQPQDSYQSIYDVTVSYYESSDQSRINQILNERFPKSMPNFNAWVRQLNRIEKKFNWRADARALLCSLGLYRRG